MPLVKQTLKSGILELLSNFKAQETITGEQAEELFADRLATIIDAYIKTATVTTTGTATNHTGTLS